MARTLLLTMALTVPLAAQTATTPTNTLTLDTLVVKSGITLGGTAPKYVLIMPTTPPPVNSVLGISSYTASTGVAQATWFGTGYSGTLKLSATCSVTVINGRITAKGGC